MGPPPLAWLADDSTPLPPTACAMGPGSAAPGLLAAGGNLTVPRLREAYRHGVFPWFSGNQPVLWWSPDPRMVLPVDGFKLSRSLRKTIKAFMRTPGSEVRIDTAFDRVIDACAHIARDDQDGTWIVPEMIAAYRAWHRAGGAHSVECWIDGQLAGGLYGISIGRMFFGESMFSRVSDASKIALAALVAFCRANGIALIDCQQNTRHLASMGAHEISRAAFEAHLAGCIDLPDVGDWSYHLAHWERIGLQAAGPPRQDPT